MLQHQREIDHIALALPEQTELREVGDGDCGLVMGAVSRSDGITLISRDEAARTIVFEITRLTPFALFEVQSTPAPPTGAMVCLPLIIK